MQKEINKFLKKINQEKLKKNHRECIELYNIVGGLHTEISSYDEAVYYHEQALDLSKTIGDRHSTAVAYRYIGEATAALGNFAKAIDCIKRYLDLAERLCNQVEKQRALTTLGRIYLMQAQDLREQSSVTDRKFKDVAKEAEIRFQAALRLADDVSDRIDAKEYAQMKTGLLINLGLVKDLCNQHEEAIEKFKQAIKICKETKLKEELFRCQIILTGIFRQRMKDSDIRVAVQISEAALQTARSIGKKIHICDALIELGLVRICQRNFKNAKKTFAQAYLEKSPNEDDHTKAIRLTKLAHLIAVAHEKACQDETSGDTKLKLCDKLGDLFVAIQNYKLAVDYYKKALDTAIVCAKPKNELARILFSLAETYSDDGHFEQALKCYQRELALRNGNNSEQCQTLIKIAHMHEYLDHGSEQVCEAYEKALEKADKLPKLMHNALKDYVPYLKRKSIRQTRMKELEQTLLNLCSYPEVAEELENDNYEEVHELEDEISNIDDIITDDEDDNEVLMVGAKRKSRGPAKFKPNEVGDTPLHEACIKGNLKRVEWLIDQGHDVNPRDNAGWIPLHEACNHGHYQIAEYLIQHGADVNNRGLKGMSPLHDAATNGHFEIMRLLLSNGANAIALTDTGETVISCLRDFKKRNYNEMSNNSISEYKYMEAELLNIMDKCGYNFMSEKIKSLGSGAGSSSSALREEEVAQKGAAAAFSTAPRPKPRNIVNYPDEPECNSIKDYKNVIGCLQRKRLKDDKIEHKTDEQPPPSQPAIYQCSTSTSISTKDWLIDDVSRQNQINKRRSNLADILDSDIGLFSSDDDDEEVERIQSNGHNSIKSKSSNNNNNNNNKRASSENRSGDRSNPSKRILLGSDDDEDIVVEHEVHRRTKSPEINTRQNNDDDDDDDVLFIGEDNSRSLATTFNLRSPGHVDEASTSRELPFGAPNGGNDFVRAPSASCFDNDWSSNSMDNRSMSAKRLAFDLFAQPLAVKIDERKLLIPIKDERLTIKQLKELIVDRYNCLVETRPIISLSPKDDLNCILFDEDLCKDVIRCDNIVAHIDAWHLQTVEASYVSNCSKSQLVPLSFIKIELRSLDNDSVNKLDFSFMRFPRSQIDLIMRALVRRPFSAADLTGLASAFACERTAQATLATIATWNKLTRLSLKCVGLTRRQFESISEIVVGQTKLPELVVLDVSVNSIAYKSKQEFCKQVEKLRQLCPKLKSLDVRRNNLQFVNSITPAASSTNAGAGAAATTTTSDETNDTNGRLNLAQSLDMIAGDLEILAADQLDYAIYQFA